MCGGRGRHWCEAYTGWGSACLEVHLKDTLVRALLAAQGTNNEGEKDTSWSWKAAQQSYKVSFSAGRFREKEGSSRRTVRHSPEQGHACHVVYKPSPRMGSCRGIDPAMAHRRGPTCFHCDWLKAPLVDAYDTGRACWHSCADSMHRRPALDACLHCWYPAGPRVVSTAWRFGPTVHATSLLPTPNRSLGNREARERQPTTPLPPTTTERHARRRATRSRPPTCPPTRARVPPPPPPPASPPPNRRRSSSARLAQ